MSNLNALGRSWGEDPAYQPIDVGFRVVIVPEPSVVGFMALGIALLAWKRKRTL